MSVGAEPGVGSPWNVQATNQAETPESWDSSPPQDATNT
jgi:hypothetical protein